MIDNTIISNNSFSAFEKDVEVQFLQFGTSKELWIHSEEDGNTMTFEMNEAIRLRDYLNSLELN